MSKTPHHGTHPDIEVLSAFAEQALGAKEHGEVLKHLALCGRCRQVVALASEATDAEVEAAQRRVAPRPRRPWRAWGFALAPAAAVVATAAIAVYVHERIVARNAEVAQLVRQRADEKLTIPFPASPQLQEPAAAPAPSPSRKTIHTPGNPVSAISSKRQPPVEYIDPGGGAGWPILTAKEEQELDRALEKPASRAAESHGTMGEPLPSAAPDESPSDASIYNEERKRRAEEKLDRHLLAVTAPAPDDEHRSQGSDGANNTPASTEPSAASTAQLEAPAEGSPRFHGLSSLANLSAHPHVFHLPSKRPAVSIASRDRRMLAVDDGGNVFLSEDYGEAWEKIDRQWAGRAIAVRRHGREADATESAQAHESASVIAPTGAVSESETLFELVNDESQVWVSEDGRIWTAK